MRIDYAKLARQEKEANQAQETAQSDYRRVWWRLTVALARAEKPGEVYREIAPILGLSESYLAQRRALGSKLDLTPDEASTLPPRKAMAYVQATKGRIGPDDAAKLREYDEEGTSLRAMTADILGEKPSYWRNAEEQRSVQPTPEQVAHAIRNNPEVRRAVVEDRDARLALGHAHNDYARERTQDETFHPERDDRNNRFFQTADIAVKIDSMSRLADEVRRLLADHAADSDTRAHYAGKLAQVGEKIEEMVTGLRSDAEFEDLLVREGLTR